MLNLKHIALLVVLLGFFEAGMSGLMLLLGVFRQYLICLFSQFIDSQKTIVA
jgi:hypothetical protein